MKTTTTEVRHLYILCSGISVSKDFYERIKQTITARLPDLQSDFPMELKKICGHAFWNNLTNGERRTAGQCVASMVNEKKLPLTHVIQKHEYPKRYRLD